MLSAFMLAIIGATQPHLHFQLLQLQDRLKIEQALRHPFYTTSNEAVTVSRRD